MPRIGRIFAVPLAILLLASTGVLLPATSGAASASGDLNCDTTGVPWIDQYIECVPSPGGSKRPGAAFGGGNSNTGLSSSQLESLTRAGGPRFAAAMAASVPAPQSIRKLSGDEALTAVAPVTSLAETLSGGSGGDGLGPVLPLILIGSVFAAIFMAGLRLRDGRRD